MNPPWPCASPDHLHCEFWESSKTNYCHNNINSLLDNSNYKSCCNI